MLAKASFRRTTGLLFDTSDGLCGLENVYMMQVVTYKKVTRTRARMYVAGIKQKHASQMGALSKITAALTVEKTE